MAQPAGILILGLVLVSLAVAEAVTPPGIAKNPSHATCKIKKYKHCYNLVHVCPKFCPDSCTVECASCKPICGPGSAPPPSDESPQPTPSTPSPTPPTPTPSPSYVSPPTPSTPSPTPPIPTPSPAYVPHPPTPSTPSPSPPTPTPSPSYVSPPTPSTPSPSPPTPTPSPSYVSPPPAPSTPPSPTPTPPTPTPSPSYVSPPPAPSTPPSPTPTPPTPTPSPSYVSPPPTPSTPSPTPPTPTPSPSDVSPPPTPSTPSPTPPTPTPSPVPPTPAPTPPTPSPTPSSPSTPPVSSPRKKARCMNKDYGLCYGQEFVCPTDCPTSCSVDCVTCKPVCSCDYPGAVCQDPRFIGGDGITFYFHGKKDEDFCLVTDSNLHINAHFIGKRSPNMTRDFTWVQSLGILFNNHRLFIGAQKTATWDDTKDRLALTFDGEPIFLPETQGFLWKSTTMPAVTITRTGITNEVVVEVEGNFKISARVVPITEEESRVHNYGITNDDCFAHLDLGFKFYSLSNRVEGVLGQTYREGYASKAKMGVAMPVLGGEKEYATSSIFATDCAAARFEGTDGGESEKELDLSSLSCASGMNGAGVVCKR